MSHVFVWLSCLLAILGTAYLGPWIIAIWAAVMFSILVWAYENPDKVEKYSEKR